jgi:hypothetical protein
MLLKTITPLTASSAVSAALLFVMVMAALLPCLPAYANTIAPSEQVVLSASAQDDNPPQVLLAEETEEGAIAAAKAYLAVHNEHDLERVMKFYAGDATFQLSNGRELISGRENIRELERFDAIAMSTLIPFGWSAQETTQGWEVSVRGVLENSTIFSAIGLNLVVAKPERPVFLMRNGLIQHSEQPDLLPACQRAALAAFYGVAKWLAERNDPRLPGLVSNGRLKLEPHLLPIVAQLITEWRNSTGWSPNTKEVWDCGSVDAVLGR